jgi:outer membrane protein insertion porin family
VRGVYLGLFLLLGAFPALVGAQERDPAEGGGRLPAEGEPEGAGAEPAAQSRRVLRIRFEGNVRYTAEYLKEQIATKIGTELDEALLSRDQSRLREFFKAVTDTEVLEVEGGVEVVFYVVDRVLVGKVELLGLVRVKETDVRALMQTRPGRPLLDHALRADRDLLTRLHRDKGYAFTHVEAYRKPTTRPDVLDIVFQVLANRRVKVRRVILEGAAALDRRLLLRNVKNSDRYRQRYLTLGRIFDISWFDRAALEQDRRVIQMHYRDEGYLDARVVLVGVRFDEERTEATIRFRIDEGERYGLASFRVTYAEDALPLEADRDFLSAESLTLLGALPPRSPYRAEDLRASVRRVRSRLWARGYARSTVQEQVTPNAETREVDVQVVLNAGPKVKVGQIRVVGNRWTRDNVIRRQFRTGARPGDYLNIEALEAARTRLLGLQYFSMVRFGRGQDWGLVKSADPNRPDEYDVLVEVMEADSTRSFNLGAGINSDGGAFGTFAVTWRNFDIGRPPDPFWKVFGEGAFRGGGQSFTISLSPGTTFSAFQLSFSDPALWDSRWSLSTSLSRRLALLKDYDQVTDGINVRVGRFLDPRFRWNLSLQWSLRQVLIENPRSDAPVNALDVQGHNAIHGIGFTLRRVARREADPFLNGHVSTVSASLYGGFLGAEVDIVKVRLEHSAGFRFFRQSQGGWHRIRINVAVDWATAFDDTREVPIYERYFLGGRNLRGFAFREVGPRSNGRPTGGEFMLRLITEYTIPLVSAEEGIGLNLVLFVDQGALTTTVDDFGWDDWRISAGFGIAIAIGGPTQPPLVVDFGWALRAQDQDERQIVSVSFVRNF